MPQLTHLTASALALAAILLLPGCTGDAPVVLPSPESSTAPVFATDEEALAAAEAAYGEYLAASNAINAKNGKDPKTIAPFVHADYLPELLDEFDEFREANRHVEGEVTFDSAELQQYSDDLDNPAEVAIYLCLDVSGARLIADDGADVTPQRNERLPLEAVLVTVDREPNLVLKSSELWTGGDFCEN